MKNSIILFITIIVVITITFAFASCSNKNSASITSESSAGTSERDENQSESKSESIFDDESVESISQSEKSSENVSESGETESGGKESVHIHSFDKQVATELYLVTEATCENFAKYYFSCECGEKGKYTFESGELAAHTPVKVEGKPATCTENGYTEGEKCSVCGAVIKPNETISALGHNIVEYAAKTPTCIAAGHKAYEACTRCDYTTYEEIKALGHDLITHTARGVTCENIGWEEYVDCARCDYSTYKEIPATGHNYDGGICKNCGDILLTDSKYFTFAALADDTFSVTINKSYVSTLPKGIKIPESYNGKKVTKIADKAFADCQNLEMIVVIPNGVTAIGTSAFSDCAALMSVEIPSSVTVIEESAFYRCSGLKEIRLPSGLEKLSKSVLSGCGGLKSIVIPSKLKTIGEYALSECGGLTEIDIPDGVTVVESNAFLNCGSLTSVTGCNGVTSFGDYAFGNDKIVAITISEVCEKIGARCFNGMSQGATITVNPASLKIIGENAFGVGASIVWNSDETTNWKIAYQWGGFVYSSATFDASYHYGYKKTTYYLSASLNGSSAEKTYRSSRQWAEIVDCTNHNEIGSYFSYVSLADGTWIRI